MSDFVCDFYLYPRTKKILYILCAITINLCSMSDFPWHTYLPKNRTSFMDVPLGERCERKMSTTPDIDFEISMYLHKLAFVFFWQIISLVTDSWPIWYFFEARCHDFYDTRIAPCRKKKISNGPWLGDYVIHIYLRIQEFIMTGRATKGQLPWDKILP